jgi:hypothetical protein
VKEIRTADQFLQDVVDWGERAKRNVCGVKTVSPSTPLQVDLP